MLKQSFNKAVLREQFFPGLLGILLNPFYFARKGLARHIRHFSGHITGKVLDIGCGAKPYEKIFADAKRYIGLEVKRSMPGANRPDICYDGTVFPFKDAQFDSIVIFEVLEHVFGPERFLKEACRVLKTNGHVLVTVPFVWDEHEQPYDYCRYSSFGLKDILTRCGFEIIESRKSVNDASAVFQLWNMYIYKTFFTGSRFVNAVLSVFLIAPVNLVGSLLAALLPGNDDLYLDNIVLAKKR